MDYRENLLKLARKAFENAYCPYSSFPVGSAVMVDSGEIFTGCNIENSSYSLCLCAERAAIGSAINSGYRKFKAVAVSAKKVSPCNPCGACLQFMSEFGSDIELILEDESGKPITRTISDYLPHMFTPADLKL